MKTHKSFIPPLTRELFKVNDSDVDETSIEKKSLLAPSTQVFSYWSWVFDFLKSAAYNYVNLQKKKKLFPKWKIGKSPGTNIHQEWLTKITTAEINFTGIFLYTLPERKK